MWIYLTLGLFQNPLRLSSQLLLLPRPVSTPFCLMMQHFLPFCPGYIFWCSDGEIFWHNILDVNWNTGGFPTCNIRLTCCIERISSSEEEKVSLCTDDKQILYKSWKAWEKNKKLTVFFFKAVEFKFICLVLCLLLQPGRDHLWSGWRFIRMDKILIHKGLTVWI